MGKFKLDNIDYFTRAVDNLYVTMEACNVWLLWYHAWRDVWLLWYHAWREVWIPWKHILRYIWLTKHFPYKSCMDVHGCALSSMVGNPGKQGMA